MAIRRRNPGDAFRIGASEWNEIVDSVDFYRRLRRTGGRGIIDRNVVGNGIIKVKNTTDATVERFGILSISQGPVIVPGSEPGATEDWLGNIVMLGTEPVEIVDATGVSNGIRSAVNKFAVMLETVGPGMTGIATIEGVTPAKVLVPSDTIIFPERVDIVDGSTEYLQHQYDGCGEVVWFSEDVGDDGGEDEEFWRLALVRLGKPAAGTFFARIDAATPIVTDDDFGPVKWRYSWEEVYGSPPFDDGNWSSMNWERRRSSDYPEGDAWNSAETININNATTWGNGARTQYVPDTFALQPIPSGRVVLMRAYRYRASSITVPSVLQEGQLRFMFSADNFVDGPCPEPDEEE